MGHDSRAMSQSNPAATEKAMATVEGRRLMRCGKDELKEKVGGGDGLTKAELVLRLLEEDAISL